MTSIKKALKTHFGFDKFRSQKQEDVVKAVVKGEDHNRHVGLTITYLGTALLVLANLSQPRAI